MISKLHLGNFKAIGATQEIPIKPITLLFGPNSAGKSSILHGLLLVRGAMSHIGYNCSQIRIDDDVIDLGGYPLFAFRRDPANTIEWSVELNVSELPSLRDRIHPEASEVLKRVLPVFEGVKTISYGIHIGTVQEEIPFATMNLVGPLKYWIDFDGETVMSMSFRDGESMRVDMLNNENSVVRQMIGSVIKSFSSTDSLSTSDESSIDEFLAKFVPELDAVITKSIFPNRVRVIGHGLPKEEAPQFFAVSRERRKEDIENTLRFWLPRSLSDILFSLNIAVSSSLNQVHYVGPLRHLPPRHLALTERIANLNVIEAPNTVWDIVLRHSDIRAEINEWLSRPFHSTCYALELRHLVQLEDTEGLMQDVLRDTRIALHELSEEEVSQAISEAESEAEDEARSEVESEVESERDLALEELRNELQGEFDSLLRLPSGDSRLEDLERLKELKSELEALDLGELPPDLDMDVESEVEARLPRALADAEDMLNPESPVWRVRGEIADIERTAKSIISFVLYSDIEKLPELLLMDKRTNTPVTFRDVGTGVSQVVPILTHAFCHNNSIIAIEQPEIHIHPALQAELGDVFIESAMGQKKNTFLIETHSEHLILRILRRIRETTAGELPEGMTAITPEDVAVIYVEPTPTGAKVMNIPVTSDGDFAEKWPGGFFDERSRELF